MCVCVCVLVCNRVSVLINPLPISHDMFISLLPVCIVNAKPQPELQRMCVLLYICVCVNEHVRVLNKHESREKKTPLVVRKKQKASTQRQGRDKCQNKG